ncbi:MAG: hypothetical protein ACRD0J_09610, partial [Acidimicrobiales bacterium]
LWGRAAPQGAPPLPAVTARLLGPDQVRTNPAGTGLMDSSRSFGHRDLVRALAAGLPQGGDVATVEDLAAQVTRSGLVVERFGAPAEERVWWRCRDGRRLASGVHERRWTTVAQIRAEQDLVALAARRAGAWSRAVGDDVVAAAVAGRPQLGPAQVAALSALAANRAGVVVVEVGAGPETADLLEAAAAGWRAAGEPVSCLAATPAEAEDTETSTGIPTGVVPSEPGRVGRRGTGASGLDGRGTGASGLDGRGTGASGVVVAVGAESWSLSQLTRLVDQPVGVKVVLVRDGRRDGPSSEALDLAAAKVGRIVAWARQGPALPTPALPTPALPTPVVAVDHGRGPTVILAATPTGARAALVEGWLQAQATRPEAVMVAPGKQEARALNEAARARLDAAGRLGERIQLGPRGQLGSRRHLDEKPGQKLGQKREASGIEVAVGDRLLVRWSREEHGLGPGAVVTVTGLSLADRRLGVRSDAGKSAALPLAALRRGQVSHCYALTASDVRRSQLSRNEVHVLAFGGIDLLRRAGVVPTGPGASDPASRAGPRVSLYVVASTSPSLARDHGPLSALAGGVGALPGPALLDRTAPRLPPCLPAETARLPAETARPPAEIAGSRSLAQLGPELAELKARLWAGLPPDPAPHRRALEQDQTAVDAGLCRAREAAGRVHQAAARVHQPSGQARAGTEVRAGAGEELRRWEARASDVTVRRAEVGAVAEGRRAWLSDHQDELGRYADLVEEVARRVDHLAVSAQVAVPAHVAEALGPRPDDPAGRAAWREGAGAIQAFRERWGVTDPTLALGPAVGARSRLSSTLRDGPSGEATDRAPVEAADRAIGWGAQPPTDRLVEMALDRAATSRTLARTQRALGRERRRGKDVDLGLGR